MGYRMYVVALIILYKYLVMCLCSLADVIGFSKGMLCCTHAKSLFKFVLTFYSGKERCLAKLHFCWFLYLIVVLVVDFQVCFLLTFLTHVTCPQGCFVKGM